MGSHVVMVVMVVVVRDIGAGRVCVSEHVVVMVCTHTQTYHYTHHSHIHTTTYATHPLTHIPLTLENTYRLPIDTATGEPVYAEATTGKKKEAVLQCALNACRLLESQGMLRRQPQG